MTRSSDLATFLSQPGMKWALLVAACGGILYFAVGLYLTPARAQTKATGPRPPATAAKGPLPPDKQKSPEDRAAGHPDSAGQQAIQDELKAAGDLKSQLEFTEKRLDDIQKLLGVVGTVGAIFGFAFAVFTYVNLKEIKSDGEREVRRLKEDADNALARLRADFPNIERMNKGVERVFINVLSESFMMVEGWDKDRYARLSEESRESIRMSEITFSALEFFDPLKSPELSRYASKIYMAFGRFYGSQYFSCHVDNHPPVENEPAVERAKIYLRKAVKSDDPRLKEQAFADLGTICCWHAAFLASGEKKTAALEEARSSFDDACAIRSYNPAALIGRAWVKYHGESKDIKGAIHDLSDLVAARDDNKLSGDEKRRYLQTAYFNRACYRAIWGGSRNNKQLLASALDDLWESKKAAIEEGEFKTWLEDFDAELLGKKDLAALSSLDSARAEVGKLKDPSAAKPEAARQL